MSATRSIASKRRSANREAKLKKVSTWTGSLEISRVQGVYLFRTKARRDRSASRLVTAAKAAGLADFAILELKHTGTNPMVCFLFGLYLVFSSPLLSGDSKEIAWLKRKIEWDDTLDQLDETCVLMR